MDAEKMRKIRFWIGINLGGTIVTAINKKALREDIERQGKANFKGTKIRLFEIDYKNHADLAAKMLGASIDSLMVCGYAKVVSEYDA